MRQRMHSYRVLAVRVIVITALLGFLINLVLGLLVFRNLFLAVTFAGFGLLLGGSFGLLEVFIRRRKSSKGGP